MITPRARRSAGIRDTAVYAPRILKAPTGWRCSHLATTGTRAALEQCGHVDKRASGRPRPRGPAAALRSAASGTAARGFGPALGERSAHRSAAEVMTNHNLTPAPPWEWPRRRRPASSAPPSSSFTTRATSTTASPESRFMTFTPWVLRPMTRMPSTGSRMITPCRVIIMSSSSGMTSLSATIDPVLSVFLRVMMPLPPRFCTR